MNADVYSGYILIPIYGVQKIFNSGFCSAFIDVLKIQFFNFQNQGRRL